MNNGIAERIKEIEREKERLVNVIAGYEQRKTDWKIKKKAFVKLKQDLYKKWSAFESSTTSELLSLERKIGVLEERTEMYKQKTLEAKGLVLKIQSAETKLRHKAEKLVQLESLLEQHSHERAVGSFETHSVAQQLRVLSDKNQQLEKVAYV